MARFFFAVLSTEIQIDRATLTAKTRGTHPVSGKEGVSPPLGRQALLTPHRLQSLVLAQPKCGKRNFGPVGFSRQGWFGWVRVLPPCSMTPPIPLILPQQAAIFLPNEECSLTLGGSVSFPLSSGWLEG
eukprot:EG_transcript_47719